MTLALVKIEETLPKQKRSRARRAAMIAHGVELLKNRDLEDVAVAEITGALGYSTGSFYSAFTDKSAFFTAVQKKVNDKIVSWIEAEIEALDPLETPLPDRLTICVDLTLRYFREYRGVMRSALRYEQKMPEAWAPNRASAQLMTDGLIAGLVGENRTRMQVAIQMAFGAMVNAVLHDPGPLHLHEDAFGESLKDALRPYLEGSLDEKNRTAERIAGQNDDA